MNLKRIWEHKREILDGVANSLFIRESIEQVALERTSICESNRCGFYDKEGISDKVNIPGVSSCGVCGCVIHLLTRSMHSKCSLHELGKQPLWESQLTKEEEDSLPLHD